MLGSATAMTPRLTVGILGGSGLYDLPGLAQLEELPVSTSFGEPSDTVQSGWLQDTRLLFLPRHGRGHRIPPHRVNYRANILALKQLGANVIISVSAVGSMKENIKPGEMLLVDQFIDCTRSRANSFFDDDGVVAHISFSEPIDSELREVLYAQALELGLSAHAGGTYVCIEGPQFSTRAESLLYRSWKVDVIGMTNLPEARLAREAGLPYACIALITDYDCWRENEEAVTAQTVMQTMKSNAENAKTLLKIALPKIPAANHFVNKYPIKQSIVTDFSTISATSRKKLGSLLG